MVKKNSSKKAKSETTTLSLSGTNVLKAVAILSVFCIHILSSIKPSPFVSSSTYQLIAVSLDQLSRISVPLFVALSGYGLYWKYSNVELGFYNLFSFLKRRASKLLPQYVLWSAVFMLLFYFVPSWGSATEQPGFLWQLLLGRGDYHLYFIPMIFQIYIFFPVILKLFKKWPMFTLAGSILLQLIWWWEFSYGGKTVTSWKYFADDGEQYLWMTNWIAYFVLGMYLPRIWNLFDKKQAAFLGIFATWLFGVGYTISNAVALINSGTDPLFAMKFTRYPLFVYSFLAVIVLSYLVAKAKKVSNILVKLGKNSYVLYLSHTLFLRIIFYLLILK